MYCRVSHKLTTPPVEENETVFRSIISRSSKLILSSSQVRRMFSTLGDFVVLGVPETTSEFRTLLLCEKAMKNHH